MSFTKAEHLFAGLNETGLNDLLKAFFTARPRHLHYATAPPLPTGSTTNWSQTVLTWTFPHVKIDFTIPTADVHPTSSGVTSPGELAVRTTMTGQAGVNPFYVPVSSQVLGICEFIVVNNSGVGYIKIKVKSVTLTPDPIIWGNKHLSDFMVPVLQKIIEDAKFDLNHIIFLSFDIFLQVGPLADHHQLELRGDAL
jgi:hypothetical protein